MIKRILARLAPLIGLALLVGCTPIADVASFGPAAVPRSSQPWARPNPRRVPIRSLPSGRGIRVISYTRGGFVLGACLDNPKTAPAFYPPYGEEFASASFATGVVFLPGSVSSTNWSGLPIICATGEVAPGTAYALAPDGVTILPALSVPERNQTMLTLPVDAYTLPGEWQLITEGTEAVSITVDITPFEAPTAILGPGTIFLAGFQPGERVKGIAIKDNGQDDWPVTLEPVGEECVTDAAGNQSCKALAPEKIRGTLWTDDGEFDLQADEQGTILLERPLPKDEYAYIFVGDQSPGLLAGFAEGANIEQAIELGALTVDPATLFGNDLGNGTATEPVRVDPTPSVVPESGASYGGLQVPGLLVVFLGLSLLFGSALARRKQAGR